MSEQEISDDIFEPRKAFEFVRFQHCCYDYYIRVLIFSHSHSHSKFSLLKRRAQTWFTYHGERYGFHPCLFHTYTSFAAASFDTRYAFVCWLAHIWCAKFFQSIFELMSHSWNAFELMAYFISKVEWILVATVVNKSICCALFQTSQEETIKIFSAIQEIFFFAVWSRTLSYPTNFEEIKNGLFS